MISLISLGCVFTPDVYVDCKITSLGVVGGSNHMCASACFSKGFLGKTTKGFCPKGSGGSRSSPRSEGVSGGVEITGSTERC